MLYRWTMPPTESQQRTASLASVDEERITAASGRALVPKPNFVPVTPQDSRRHVTDESSTRKWNSPHRTDHLGHLKHFFPWSAIGHSTPEEASATTLQYTMMTMMSSGLLTSCPPSPPC